MQPDGQNSLGRTRGFQFLCRPVPFRACAGNLTKLVRRAERTAIILPASMEVRLCLLRMLLLIIFSQGLGIPPS
jgi:hypothetical protein